MPYRTELRRPDLKGVFKCSLCNKQFCHSSSLSRHRMQAHFKSYTCTLCNKEITNNETLRAHMFRKHQISRMFMCRCCNWAFPDKTSLHIHVQAMSTTNTPGNVAIIAKSTASPDTPPGLGGGFGGYTIGGDDDIEETFSEFEDFESPSPTSISISSSCQGQTIGASAPPLVAGSFKPAMSLPSQMPFPSLYAGAMPSKEELLNKIRERAMFNIKQEQVEKELTKNPKFQLPPVSPFGQIHSEEQRQMFQKFLNNASNISQLQNVSPMPSLPFNPVTLINGDGNNNQINPFILQSLAASMASQGVAVNPSLLGTSFPRLFPGPMPGPLGRVPVIPDLSGLAQSHSHLLKTVDAMKSNTERTQSEKDAIDEDDCHVNVEADSSLDVTGSDDELDVMQLPNVNGHHDNCVASQKSELNSQNGSDDCHVTSNTTPENESVPTQTPLKVNTIKIESTQSMSPSEVGSKTGNCPSSVNGSPLNSLLYRKRLDSILRKVPFSHQTITSTTEVSPTNAISSTTPPNFLAGIFAGVGANGGTNLGQVDWLERLRMAQSFAMQQQHKNVDLIGLPQQQLPRGILPSTTTSGGTPTPPPSIDTADHAMTSGSSDISPGSRGSQNQVSPVGSTSFKTSRKRSMPTDQGNNVTECIDCHVMKGQLVFAQNRNQFLESKVTSLASKISRLDSKIHQMELNSKRSENDERILRKHSEQLENRMLKIQESILRFLENAKPNNIEATTHFMQSLLENCQLTNQVARV